MWLGSGMQNTRVSQAKLRSLAAWGFRQFGTGFYGFNAQVMAGLIDKKPPG